MKAHLTHRGRDFDLGGAPLSNEAELVQDLELTTLFEAMALGDKFLFEVSRRAVLSSLTDPEEIVYRQRILTDCIARPEIVREMYAIAVEAVVREKKIYRPAFAYPSSILSRSVEVLQMFVPLLKKLREIADEHEAEFRSEGFTSFFDMLEVELGDEYFHAVDEHLRRLRFRDGVLMSAGLGAGNKGVRYVLRTPPSTKRRLKERIGIGPRSSYSFAVADRDEAGAKALSELTNRGINLAANALAQSTDHILSFFTMLCRELGFYVSCLNLHGRLVEKGEPVCRPVPSPPGARELAFVGLYDVCLALRAKGPVVGNDARAGGKSLVMITGANSGGKSTFLRSTGLAQLMMQCGMFVGAESFRASVCDGLFTHFTREEDASMTSGKLDEELSRMSVIADQMTPRCIALFNESFSATNEREGSEIARQIVRALLEADVKVFFVTHMFDLAEGFYHEELDTALFLRAEREEDGRRSFKLVEGEPLPTSFGEDLYERIGGWAAAPSASASSPPA